MPYVHGGNKVQDPCLWCEQLFTQKIRGPGASYCSPNCRLSSFRFGKEVARIGAELRLHPLLAERMRRVFLLRSEGIPIPER